MTVRACSMTTDQLTQRWYVERDYDFGGNVATDYMVGPLTSTGVVPACRCQDEDAAYHIRDVHNAALPVAPALVVVPADAVTDTGEHDPEDDGQPTNEEIDEAAAYASLVDFSHMTRAFRRVKGGAA